MVDLSGDKLKKIQELLNKTVKPKPPLEVDGKMGDKTASAIKLLQAKAKIKQTGEIDDATAVVVARVIKTGKIEKEEERLYYNIGGKLVGLTKKEHAAVTKNLISQLRSGPLLEMRNAVSAAEILWDHFHKLNKDQWFVSWCIETTSGADLPKRSVINNAKNAYKQMDALVKSGNFKAFTAAYPQAEKITNNAIEVMRAYRTKMIDGGGSWVTGLKFTKAASFTFVGVFSAPVTGAALGTGALASAVIGGAAVAVTQSSAGELGHWAAGTPNWTLGNAVSNILIDGGVGAILGVFAKGGTGGTHIFEAAVTKLGPKIAADQGFKILSKEGVKRLSVYLLTEGGKGTLTGVVKDAGKAVKGDPKLTGEKFIDNMMGNFVKGMALGPLGKVLGNYGAGKVPSSIQNKIWMQALKEVSKTSGKGQLSLKDVDSKTVSLVQNMIASQVKLGASTAATQVFKNAKGPLNPAAIDKKMQEQVFNSAQMKKMVAIAVKETQKSIGKKR